MPLKDKKLHKQYCIEYKKKNKEKMKLQQIQYRAKIDVLEKRNIYNNLYYNDIGRKRYEENKDNINSTKRKLHAENPEILKEAYKKAKKCACVICSKSAKKKYCSKKCMGIGMESRNNRFWNGGSKEGYPENWTRRFKIFIRKRDGYKCMKCNLVHLKNQVSFDVHHIDGIKNNTCKENCITLCKKCHSIIETRPEEEKIESIKMFYSILTELYGYKPL